MMLYALFCTLGLDKKGNMNKLTIHTKYPSVVASLLKTYDLVDGTPHLPEIGATENLEVYYPDDAISMALGYWFVMAIGCGLVREYKLEMFWEKKKTAQEILQPYVKIEGINDR